MNSPVATVIDTFGHYARVQVESAACPRCAAGKGCGAGLIGGGRPGAAITAKLIDGLSVQPGQTVHLAVSDRSLLRGSLYLYGAPLLGLVVGTAVSTLVPAAGDGAALVAAAFGLLAGGLAGAVLARRDRCLASLTPSIVEPPSAARPHWQ